MLGRFIQVQTRLNGNDQGTSPILFDLTIASASASTSCDVNGSGATDNVDVGLVRAAIGLTVPPGDIRDQDGNGVITMNDARACVLLCTKPRCAP